MRFGHVRLSKHRLEAVKLETVPDYLSFLSYYFWRSPDGMACGAVLTGWSVKTSSNHGVCL